MIPTFTPTNGIGSTYKDPQTGEIYKYTATGWVKQSQDIQKETVESGTFEVKPNEEEFVTRLKATGASTEQVKKVLTDRRRILSNLGREAPIEEVAPEELEAPEKDMSNPFGGMTKQEMLRDAFNKGVRDTKELEKLDKIYDLLIGTDEEQLISSEEFETLTPAQQEQARGKLKKIVITKGQELGTGLEREGVLGTVGTFDTGQDLIDMLEKVKTGLIVGAVRGGLSVFGKTIIPGTRAIGKTTEEEDRLSSLMTVYTAQFIKAISGTQVSDKEREFLDKALPNETKTVQNNIEGVKAIEDFLANRYSASLGVDISPLKSEKGRNDPMKIFSEGEEDNPLGI